MGLGKNLVISMTIGLIIIVIIYVAGNYRDFGKNGELNAMATECENALVTQDSAKLAECDEIMLDEMQANCDITPNYDICTNTRIEDYYYAR